jgi:hypothetical protein
MKFMILIASDDAADPAPGTPEFQAMMDGYFTFNAEAGQAGVLLAGEALLPASTATTVRVRNGEALHTDGPYAETKELLGGFYVLDVPDRDAALAWAAKIPTAAWGSVEVRQVAVIEMSAGTG